MIAITFALRAESSDLIRNCLRDRVVTRAGRRKIIKGKILQHQVAIFHTGVGRKAAEKNIEQFLNTVQPKVLISSGFAGAIRPGLKVGASVIGTNFSHPGLIEKFVPQPTTRLFTVPSIIDSVEQRSQLAAETGADAVEMETEVIARACATRGVRMLSLRVVSDTNEEPFPLPPSTLFNIDRQRTNFEGLVSCLVRNPDAIPKLIRFKGQIDRARRGVQNAVVWVLTEFQAEPFKSYLGL